MSTVRPFTAHSLGAVLESLVDQLLVHIYPYGFAITMYERHAVLDCCDEMVPKMDGQELKMGNDVQKLCTCFRLYARAWTRQLQFV